MPTRASGVVLRRYRSFFQAHVYTCSTTGSQRLSRSTPPNLVNHGRSPLAIPSSAHSRISGSLCTESFQRYASSTPTLKIPPIGRLPSAARYSLPFFPFAQDGVSPLRACRSANRIEAFSPIVLMLSSLSAPPPELATKRDRKSVV